MVPGPPLEVAPEFLTPSIKPSRLSFGPGIFPASGGTSSSNSTAPNQSGPGMLSSSLGVGGSPTTSFQTTLTPVFGRRSAFSATPPSASVTPTLPPTITSISYECCPNHPGRSAREGEILAVTGQGLDGLTSVKLEYAMQIVIVTNGVTKTVWVPVTNALKNFPVVVTNSEPTGFKFTVPNVTDGVGDVQVVLTITKGPISVTSASDYAFLIRPKLVAGKILSVEQTNVLGGAWLKVYGQGLYNVYGGYFGTGPLNSPSNPLIGAGDRTSDYVELLLRPDLEQRGNLVLVAVGEGSERLIFSDSPIVVNCVKSLPTGHIVGTDTSANGVMEVPAGSKIQIRGQSLSVVTRVVDQNSNSYPFSYYSLTYAPAPNDYLQVTLPNTPGLVLGFAVEHKLFEPSSRYGISGSVKLR